MKSVPRHAWRIAWGFTVVEMVVSVAIMMAVTGAVFALLNPAQGTFLAQPEVSDMQQRLRIGADALYNDLLMAGAGPYSGSSVGSLGSYFATVLPFRRGAQSPDPPGSYQTDRVSLLYVPSQSSQTTTSLATADIGADIRVDAQPGCSAIDPLCGFKTGMTAVIFDDTGRYDTFRITGLASSPATVEHVGQPLSKAYGVGSRIAQIVAATYWLKIDALTKTYQLMRYDGFQTDVPVADNVVGPNFEYYGDPQPPVLRKPLTEPKGPWTSYGPKPPAFDVNDPADSWGEGENCIFTVEESQQMTRPEVVVLGSVTDPLVKLDSSRLTDGPWCPDGGSPARVDADLLRVRKIRVTLRVQVGLEALRGTDELFARPGTARGGERYVPDQEIKFDVTPRNLNLWR
jgi:hypothetical protein